MIHAVHAGEGCQRSAAGAVHLGPPLLLKVSCRKGPTSLEPKSRSAAQFGVKQVSHVGKACL